MTGDTREEREGFLARWSRRKRAAAAGDPGAAAGSAPPAGPAASPPAAPVAAPTSGQPRPAEPHATPAPGTSEPGRASAPSPDAEPPADTAAAASPRPAAFDPATLPPVESLTAESDIRDFLRAEVPRALRQAALRRLWVLDPRIRDFVGPADYAWDFNAPDGVPGFAPTLGEEAARLVARAVGLEGRESPQAPPREAATTPGAEGSPPADAPAASAPEAPPPPGPAALAPPEPAATPDSSDTADRAGAEAAGPPRPTRRHGGAVPV